jgi:hypothetical protein
LDEGDHGDLVVAIGTKTKIIGVNTMHERVLLTIGQVSDRKAVDVLYVPSVAKNLVSIPQINQSDKFYVVFEHLRMHVLNKKSKQAVAPDDLVDGRTVLASHMFANNNQSPPWRSLMRSVFRSSRAHGPSRASTPVLRYLLDQSMMKGTLTSVLSCKCRCTMAVSKV